MRSKIVFITGTDTGVGKTLLTGLLLARLRQTGRRALALKPFCSGSRADVRLLKSLQRSELSADKINPFYFSEPLAPFVAARLHRRTVGFSRVRRHIEQLAGSCDCLLVEGIGGLLVPLGPWRSKNSRKPSARWRQESPGFEAGYTVLDLIAALWCSTVIVARNSLGTINHTLLTIRTLWQSAAQNKPPTVVLMEPRKRDLSSESNYGVLGEFLSGARLRRLPFLPGNCSTARVIEGHAASLVRLLDPILALVEA